MWSATLHVKRKGCDIRRIRERFYRHKSMVTKGGSILEKAPGFFVVSTVLAGCAPVEEAVLSIRSIVRCWNPIRHWQKGTWGGKSSPMTWELWEFLCPTLDYRRNAPLPAERDYLRVGRAVCRLLPLSSLIFTSRGLFLKRPLGPEVGNLRMSKEMHIVNVAHRCAPHWFLVREGMLLFPESKIQLWIPGTSDLPLQLQVD